MKIKTKNGRRRRAQKEESVLITKESFSAVCVLFSFLILLILFTDSLIFGEIGRITHDFFLGAFGYFAYPIFLSLLAFATAAFFDKRLIKKRLAFFSASVAVISLALVLQTALTYSWPMDNYASACFKAGESFATSTILGWVGGTLIFAVSSMLGKIGALIAFSLVSLFTVYITAILSGNKTLRIRKNAKKSKDENTVNTIKGEETENEAERMNTQSSQNAQENFYPPMQRESFSGSSYSYAQRPSVIINENDYYSGQNAQNFGKGFSPFDGYQQPRQAQTVTNEEAGVPTDAEGRRNFLFNNTPAEIYQKNLIFDRNSSVNKRAPADPNQQSYKVEPTQTTELKTGFSSYTNVYENGLNEQTQLKKIYQSESREVSNEPVYNRNDRESESFLNVERETITPRLQETLSQNDRTDRLDLNISRESARTDIFARETERSFDEKVDRVEESSLKDEGGYRRHEYMDYFSLSNPNIFGNDRTESERAATTNLEQDRTTRDFPERAVRDENIISNRFTSRDEVSSLDLNSDRRNGGLLSLDEKSTDSLNIFDDDEPEITEVKTEKEPERSIGFRDRTISRNLESVTFKSEQREAPKQAVETVEPVKKPRIYRPYVPAPLHYFDCTEIIPDADPNEIEEMKSAILRVYERVGFTEVSISSVSFGPSLTRYNLVAAPHIIPTRLATKDIEAAMAMALRHKKVNVYLNYEEGVVSIEVPNKQRQTVQLGCMLTGSEYTDAKPTSLTFSIGKDIVNKKMYGDICKMVHLLVAGSTGSGKSVFLNTLIVSLINKYSPEQLRLILIDPKKTEFVIYNNLPHLMINEIITDPRKAIQSLNWAVGEMNRRYELFSKMSKEGKHVVNLDEYNAAVPQEEKLPKIVIVVDELADLMLASKKEVEERIQNITQKSRAAGIHMIIATQRPSTDVITGVIKANLATRIAFMVASDVDSRVILDASGAQKLLGYGDMLYGTVGREPTRAQCAFISSADCQKIVNFIKENNEAYYDDEATQFISNNGHAPAGDEETGEAIVEEVYIEALKHVILSNSASISMIQRKCSVGYNKAGKIVEWMEDMGYISPYDGAKARKVLISKEEFESLYGEI